MQLTIMLSGSIILVFGDDTMAKFDEFFLMNTEDVKEYAVKLKLFSPEDNIISEEIGDGNIGLHEI